LLLATANDPAPGTLPNLFSDHHFLDFMDEVAPAIYPKSFFFAMSLRNILRALGISPILMSTHTGAQNAVPARGADSRGDTSTLWVYLITELPGAVMREGSLDSFKKHPGRDEFANFCAWPLRWTDPS
jgi:hypothetical protein